MSLLRDTAAGVLTLTGGRTPRTHSEAAAWLHLSGHHLAHLRVFLDDHRPSADFPDPSYKVAYSDDPHTFTPPTILSTQPSLNAAFTYALACLPTTAHDLPTDSAWLEIRVLHGHRRKAAIFFGYQPTP